MKRIYCFIFYKVLGKHFDVTAFIIPNVEKKGKIPIQMETIPRSGLYVHPEAHAFQ